MAAWMSYGHVWCLQRGLLGFMVVRLALLWESSGYVAAEWGVRRAYL